jgi:hypothetical protein
VVRLLPTVGMAIGIFLLLNSFWIIPTLTSTTPRETLIGQFDRRHLLSFRTDGANDASVVGNVIAMYGYWGDREGRYTLPRSIMPLWPLLLLSILGLVGYGFYKTKSNPISQTLAASALLATIVAVGIIAAPFSYINEWLLSAIPALSAFREPQKFVTLIVLFYAVLGGVGLEYLQHSKRIQSLFTTHYRVAISGALIIPFIYTPTLMWGFAGQLHSATYPADWAIADQQYIHAAAGKTLFLPWHQYMYLDFAGRVTSNPAPAYFGPKVISGTNVEIGLIDYQSSNKSSQDIETILQHKDPQALGEDLATMGIQYVVISKNADWKRYGYFDQSGLEKVQDSPTLVVYRNKTFRQL